MSDPKENRPGQGGSQNTGNADSTEIINAVVAKLQADGKEPYRNNYGWFIACPTDNSTIRISIGRELDLKCMAHKPCTQDEVIDKLGLRDLFPANTRRVNLGPYLDGTFKAPTPTVGGIRDDGVTLLYPGLWHTCVALTTAGKSWFALWHAIQVMRSGGTVTYAHFEESSPAGTLSRLRGIAPELAPEKIQEQFIWLDCTQRWSPTEFASNLPNPVGLVILDGINAACSQHAWPVDKPEGVTNYRTTFVTPAARLQAAVLSLGHPPKSRDRQGERHGFGSTAWLDEVDGVGFRLEASKKTPIQLGTKGHSNLYLVKDRWAQTQQHGTLKTDREGGWYYLGAFTVDSSPSRDNTVTYLTGPSPDGWGVVEEKRDSIDILADRIMEALMDGTGRFESARQLGDLLRAREIQFTQNDLTPALIRLEVKGRIKWPEVAPKRPRPGWVPIERLEADPDSD